MVDDAVGDVASILDASTATFNLWRKRTRAPLVLPRLLPRIEDQSVGPSPAVGVSLWIPSN